MTDGNPTIRSADPLTSKTLAVRFVEAFNAGELATVHGLLAEEATWFLYGDLPPSGLWQDRDAILNEFLQIGGRLFEPGSPQFRITTAIAEGHVSILELEAHGRNARGEDYDSLYVLAFETRGEQIVAVREYMDTECWRRSLCD
jgi:uncharacterized protein